MSKAFGDVTADGPGDGIAKGVGGFDDSGLSQCQSNGQAVEGKKGHMQLMQHIEEYGDHHNDGNLRVDESRERLAQGRSLSFPLGGGFGLGWGGSNQQE